MGLPNLAAMSSTRVVSGGRTGFRHRRVALVACVHQHLHICTMYQLKFILEITIARKCCLKGTDWKLAFGSSVGIIENILACVQPELQASYTRNTYSNA